MNSNFTTVLKKKAIANVPAFSNIKPNRIKVVSNSPKYPNSVTMPMDVYCDVDTDGYIFYNSATGDAYAMTAVEVSAALSSMINNKKCWKPNTKDDADLLRLTFDSLIDHKF